MLTRVSSCRTPARHHLRPRLADVTYFSWNRVAPGQIELACSHRRKNLDGEIQEHAVGAFPASISYRITEQDTPLGGRRLILEIEPAVISACQFGLRTRDTGTIDPENI